MDSAPNPLAAQPDAEDIDATFRGRVLVAEDTEINQLLAMSQLERLGYECVIAENGVLAAAAVAEGGFDAVLMDWHMPEADGLEATRLIRSAEDGSHRIPIIAVTAAAMAGDRERCLAAGMDDFLSKPVSIEDLRGTLAHWIPGRSDVTESAGRESTAAPRSQPPSGSADRRVIDEATLDQLAADLGDPAVVCTLIDTFLAELDERIGTIAQLDQARRSPEAANEVMRAAHQLKSTSGLLGAAALADLCGELEGLIKHASREGDESVPAETVEIANAIVGLSAGVGSELVAYAERISQ